MKEDLKKEWVAALRSGKFRQGSQALKKVGVGLEGDKTSYCCLGVLCETLGLAQEGPPEDDGYVRFLHRERGSMTSLPETLREEVGLRAVEEGRLIQMNDRDGKTFAQIADWIEENL